MIIIPNLIGQFVSLFNGESPERVGVALITGFVHGVPYGIKARVYDLGRGTTSVVSFENCKIIPVTKILQGLKGLQAKCPHYGVGVIEAERTSQKLLEVCLKAADRTESVWLPLDQVVVLGPAV